MKNNLGPLFLSTLVLLITFARASMCVDTLKIPFKTLSYGNIKSMNASGNEKRILITGGDGNVRLCELSTGKIIKTFEGKQIRIAATQFSPDGGCFAMGFNLSYGAMGGGLSIIWLGNSANGDSIATFSDMTSTYANFGFSPVSSSILVGLSDCRLLFLDSSLKPISTAITDAPVKNFSFAGNGTSVLIHTSDSASVLLALPSLAIIKKYDKKVWGDCNFFYLSPDGAKIIKGSGTKSLPMVFDAVTGNTLLSFPNDTTGNAIYNYYEPQIALSPNGQLALVTNASSLNVWDIVSGICIATMKKIQKGWGSDSYLGFSSDNTKAIAGNTINGDTIWVWDIASKTLISKTCGYVIGQPYTDSMNTTKITAYCFKEDTMLSINLKDGKVSKTYFPGYFLGCSKIAFSPNGTTVFALGNRGGRIWETSSGRVLSDLRGVQQMFPDQRIYLFTDGVNRYLNSIDNNTLDTIIMGADGLIHEPIIGISSDYHTVLTERYDSLFTYDLSLGKKLCSIPRHQNSTDALISAALSPDGAYVVTGVKRSGKINIYNAITGDLKVVQTRNANEVFVFSSVDNIVLSINETNAGVSYSCVWKMLDTSHTVSSYNYSIESEGYSLYHKVASFSPDGSKILINNKLFETKGGKLLKVIDQNENDISCVNFSPDGSKIAIGSALNSIFLWDITGNSSKIDEPRTNFPKNEAKASIMLLSSGHHELRFLIPSSVVITANTRLNIFDLSGRLVTSELLQPALKENKTCTMFFQNTISTGIYIYKFTDVRGSYSGLKGSFFMK
jgi:WD40 repeat protein